MGRPYKLATLRPHRCPLLLYPIPHTASLNAYVRRDPHPRVAKARLGGVRDPGDAGDPLRHIHTSASAVGAICTR